MSSKNRSVPLDKAYDPHSRMLMKRAFYYLIANDTTWGSVEQTVLANSDVGQYLADYRGLERCGHKTVPDPCSMTWQKCKQRKC